MLPVLPLEAKVSFELLPITVADDEPPPTPPPAPVLPIGARTMRDQHDLCGLRNFNLIRGDGVDAPTYSGCEDAAPPAVADDEVPDE